MDCRLLMDDAGAGAWNMAVDEQLLEQAETRSSVSLRFYAWSEPTLSLGYFQPLADRGLHPASRHCPAVRRSSGGGAIVHDLELTYSFALPDRKRGTRRSSEIYALFHRTLIETLADWGVQAALYGDPATRPVATRPATNDRATPPFLCFQRRSADDVVVGDVKIAGSAQRRQRSALLQHGSILLGRSLAAPELPGLEQLAPLGLTRSALVDAWRPRLSAALELDLRPDVLQPDEHRRSEAIVRDQYGAASWTGLK